MGFLKNIFSKNYEVAIRLDNDLNQLKLEAKNLENKVNYYVNEKTELEKLLADFQYKHTIELGDLILEILQIKQLKFEIDTKEYKDAEDDANKYNEQFKKEKKKQKYDLNETEKLELKKQFRKASFLCHPDKIVEELKEEASKVFCELKAAYEANDLNRVNEILHRLESGNLFNSLTEHVSEKKELIILIEKLKNEISNLENDILWIKKTDTYKTIIVIDDFDNYFKKTKENLQSELDVLKNVKIIT